MPSRFRGTVRRLRYRYLVLRDGERCYLCGQVPLGAEDCITYSLDIDHYDEDKTNDDEANLRLCCRPCNVTKQNLLRRLGRKKVDITGSSTGSSTCQPICSSTLSVNPRSESGEKCSSNLRAPRSEASQGQSQGVREREHVEKDASVKVSKTIDSGTPNTRIYKGVIPYGEGSPEMQANGLFEVDYRDWLLHHIADIGFVPKREAINAGAELVGCNPTTAAKYLAKLTSMVGPLAESRDSTGQVMVFAKARPPEKIWEEAEAAAGVSDTGKAD